jgi:hypothetical protein
MTQEQYMAPHSQPSTGFSRRAARLRSRIVFFLLRRALRRMGVRGGLPARTRTSLAALAVHHS